MTPGKRKALIAAAQAYKPRVTWTERDEPVWHVVTVKRGQKR